ALRWRAGRDAAEVLLRARLEAGLRGVDRGVTAGEGIRLRRRDALLEARSSRGLARGDGGDLLRAARRPRRVERRLRGSIAGLPGGGAVLDACALSVHTGARGGDEGRLALCPRGLEGPPLRSLAHPGSQRWRSGAAGLRAGIEGTTARPQRAAEGPADRLPALEPVELGLVDTALQLLRSGGELGSTLVLRLLRLVDASEELCVGAGVLAALLALRAACVDARVIALEAAVDAVEEARGGLGLAGAALRAGGLQAGRVAEACGSGDGRCASQDDETH